MIVFSALRLNMPIIGMFKSTVKVYVTVVLAPLAFNWYEPSMALSRFPLEERPTDGLWLPLVRQNIIVLQQRVVEHHADRLGRAVDEAQHLGALHRVDPIVVVLEIGDDRHAFIGPCRDIDAGAGLIRHEP
jgi:hypothetical protein